jgi:Sec-independent protein secretion pathway component TatC
MKAGTSTTAWITFLVSLLVLSLAATPYWRAADQLLIAIRLSIIVVISILFVRSRWRRRRPDTGPSDRGDSLLLRLRRWYHGE